MDLSWIDWLIILVPLGAVFWIGYQAQRCVKGVADFLSPPDARPGAICSRSPTAPPAWASSASSRRLK